MKKTFILGVVIILALSMFAKMTTDNIDRPETKSDWQATETRFVSLGYSPIPVLTENFEGGVMPAGWEVVSAHPDTSWMIVSSSSNMYPPNRGTYFACFDPYSDNYFLATKEQLYTPAISAGSWISGYVRYDFSMQDYSGNGDFNVYIKTFNGTWSSNVLLINHTIDLISTDTLDVSAYLPAESLKICFEFEMSAAVAWGLAVDNVEVGYLTPPDYDCVLKSIRNPSSAIVVPPAPFEPEIMAMNAGTLDMANVDFYCIIEDTVGIVYSEMYSVDTLYAQDSVNLKFDTFTPNYLSKYFMTVYSVSGLDIYPENDTLTLDFRTFDVDVAIIDASPANSNINANEPYELSGTFVNNATMASPFTAVCEIYDNTALLIYLDSVNVPSIQPGETLNVHFNYFNSGLPEGNYSQNIYCVVNHDLNNGNNAMFSSFNVINGAWEAVDNTGLQPAQWAGVCQDENSIWMMGGLASSTGQTYVQRYDTLNGWTHVTDLPAAILSQACAIIDSHLYVIGGMDAGFTTYNTVYIYDIAGNSWSTGTPYPEALGGMGGGVYNGKMYLVGGLYNGSFLGRTPVYCYDPSADTAGGSPWDTMTSCPRGANGLALGANFFGNPESVNTPIIVGGDYQGINSYYMYEPDADTIGGTPWTDITYYTYGNIGTKTPLIMWDNDYAYLVGGDVYGFWGGYYPGWTYYYDFASGNWTDMIRTTLIGLEGSGGGILGDYIYTAGGTIGSGAISPAPFEKTFRVGKESAKQLMISYTYPTVRQLQAPVDELIVIGFSQPVDTTYGFSYTVKPNPGLLTHYFSENFDTVYIAHDYLEYDESYYVKVTAYDTLGNALTAGNIPNPFGFNTGLTGVEKSINTYKFSFKGVNAFGSSSVLFKYTLPSNGDVVIDIYNLTGAKVKSMSVKNESAGLHSIEWNASELASGIYMYRATFGKNVYSSKIAIVK